MHGKNQKMNSSCIIRDCVIFLIAHLEICRQFRLNNLTKHCCSPGVLLIYGVYFRRSSQRIYDRTALRNVELCQESIIEQIGKLVRLAATFYCTCGI